MDPKTEEYIRRIIREQINDLNIDESLIQEGQ